MNRILFSLTAFLIAITNCWSQAAVVQIETTGYSHKKAVLYQNADPISGKREALAIADVDENGKCTFSFTPTETQAYWISIARVEGLLYIEPGGQYSIRFPSADQADIKRFDRTEITLDLSQLPETDLNMLIRQFNADYINFLHQHYFDFIGDEFKSSGIYRSTLGSKSRTSDIYKMPSTSDSAQVSVATDFHAAAQAFIAQMTDKYSSHFSHSYFNNYVKYALAEIRLVAGMNRVRFASEYFISQPMQYNNTAYIKTFQTFYNGLFQSDTNAKLDSLERLIHAGNNIEGLTTYFQRDSTLRDVSVARLAVLINLKNAYYKKEYARPAIISTIQSLQQTNASEFQKQIASNLLSQMKRYERGTIAEDFTIGDARENKWILSEHLGMPTYLYFFAQWNTASLKEMLLLDKLYHQYKNDIQIITICMDDDYEKYKQYLRQHKDFKFPILYGAGDPLISEKYNMRSIPHAVQLDREGKWSATYTRRPSEGVEDDFNAIKKNNAKPSQSTRTWKDK